MPRIFPILAVVVGFAWGAASRAQTIGSPVNLVFKDAAPDDTGQRVVKASGMSFLVSGTANAKYCLTYSPALTQSGSINMTKGANNIGADSLDLSVLGAGGCTGQLDGTGKQTIQIGATRHALDGSATGSKTAGVYPGSVTATVRACNAKGNCTGPTSAASANFQVTVIQSISLAPVSAVLDFGTHADGDGFVAVSPGAAGSASFSVQGQSGKMYTIQLPSSVTMQRAGCGPCTSADQITVDQFSSSPSSPDTLGAGATTLYVGGRADFANGRTPGNYTQTFTVTVAYQ